MIRLLTCLSLPLVLAVAGCSVLPASVEPMTASDSADVPKVDRLSIVDRAIEYHGGDLFRSSKVSFRVTSASGSFDVEARRDGGNFTQRVRTQTDEGLREVTSTNDRVSVTLDGEAQTVEASEQQRLRDFVSARVYFGILPFPLSDPGVYLQDLGIEPWYRRPLHKVKVTFQPDSSTDADDEYLYWFDPQSGRLEQFAYSFAGGGGGLRFRRLIDYRRVGGILFFDQQNFGIDGCGCSVDTIDPTFVSREMHYVSTVRFENVRVEPAG